MKSRWRKVNADIVAWFLQRRVTGIRDCDSDVDRLLAAGTPAGRDLVIGRCTDVAIVTEE
jgi:hypothetical protein